MRTDTVSAFNYGSTLKKSLGYGQAQQLMLSAGWIAVRNFAYVLNAMLLDIVGRNLFMSKATKKKTNDRCRTTVMDRRWRQVLMSTLLRSDLSTFELGAVHYQVAAYSYLHSSS